VLPAEYPVSGRPNTASGRYELVALPQGGSHRLPCAASSSSQGKGTRIRNHALVMVALWTVALSGLRSTDSRRDSDFCKVRPLAPCM